MKPLCFPVRNGQRLWLERADVSQWYWETSQVPCCTTHLAEQRLSTRQLYDQVTWRGAAEVFWSSLLVRDTVSCVCPDTSSAQIPCFCREPAHEQLCPVGVGSTSVDNCAHEKENSELLWVVTWLVVISGDWRWWSTHYLPITYMPLY